MAQSLQITWGNLSPPVSAGRLALQLITGAAQITFLKEVNILELLSFNEILFSFLRFLGLLLKNIKVTTEHQHWH